MLAAVAALLEERGVEVVGRAADGDAALRAVERWRPDVAVVDSTMPGLGGLDVIARGAAVSPGTAFVLYADAHDATLLTRALDAGARGVVLKEAPLVELATAVERAAAGEVYVDPVLGGAHAGLAGHAPPGLTRREREVLGLLADGGSTETIGATLGISGETVRTHVRRAMTKLGAETRTHAVAIALRRSIIS